MKGCLLNRKPFLDKDGKFRVRTKCCNDPENCEPPPDDGFHLDEIQRMAEMRKEAGFLDGK